MKRRNILWFGMLAPALCLTPTDSNADWFRGAGSLCKDKSAYIRTRRRNNATEGSSTISGGQLICPLYEREGLQRTQLSSLKLWAHDRDPNDGVEAQLCRRAYDGATATCTPISNSGNSFTGVFTFGTSGTNSSSWSNWSSWTSSNSGFSYIYINLTGSTASSQRSRVYGYYAES